MRTLPPLSPSQPLGSSVAISGPCQPRYVIPWLHLVMAVSEPGCAWAPSPLGERQWEPGLEKKARESLEQWAWN